MASKHAPSAEKQAEQPDKEQASPQPRPFWSGVIAFGLVSLPVSLFPANRGKSLSLNIVDQEGMRLRRRYFCEKEGTVLDMDDIVRGFPVDRDQFVTVDDEELQALAPEKTREIDLRRFVPMEDVNPVFFERGYFLAPDSGATKAYRLLAESMGEEGRVGIATFVMRDREYIIAIIAEQGILRAETLRFHDEIRTPEDVGLPALARADEARVTQMREAMDAQAEQTFDRSLLTEAEALRVRDLVDHKRDAGVDLVEEPSEPVPEEESNVVDLMQVLKERLQAQDGGEQRGQSRRQPQSDEATTTGSDGPVEELSREQLYARARELHIAGRSKMTKRELMRAVSKTG